MLKNRVGFLKDPSSYCDTALHVLERLFGLVQIFKINRASPNLTTDGLSPIRAGIFTSNNNAA